MLQFRRCILLTMYAKTTGLANEVKGQLMYVDPIDNLEQNKKDWEKLKLLLIRNLVSNQGPPHGIGCLIMYVCIPAIFADIYICLALWKVISCYARNDIAATCFCFSIFQANETLVLWWCRQSMYPSTRALFTLWYAPTEWDMLKRGEARCKFQGILAG